MAAVGPGDGVSAPKSISWPTATLSLPEAPPADTALSPAAPCSASFNTQYLTHLYLLTAALL